MLREELIRYTELLGVQSAFVIVDLKTQKTIAYNEKQVVPSASLIKVPVMIKAFCRMEAGTLDGSARIFVKPEDVVPYSVLGFLDSGNTYTLLDLIRLMIVYSDNTAANIMIELLGMDSINRCIQEFGWSNTKLQRKMMDVQSRKEGRENLTTAEEMADLMMRLYTGNLIGRDGDAQMLAIMKGQADECMMRVDLPDDIIIARKSGELENLDHEIAIVFGEQRDYLYVFFVWDARSNNEARQILQNTSKMVYDYFNQLY